MEMRYLFPSFVFSSWKWILLSSHYHFDLEFSSLFVMSNLFSTSLEPSLLSFSRFFLDWGNEWVGFVEYFSMALIFGGKGISR